MADSRIVDSYDQTKKHYAWRRKVSEAMPDLARRVFDLRNKSYYGCGFHYALERRFGLMMAMVNDYDDPIEHYTPMADEIAYEDFVERLERAEWSAANNAADPFANQANRL